MSILSRRGADKGANQGQIGLIPVSIPEFGDFFAGYTVDRRELLVASDIVLFSVFVESRLDSNDQDFLRQDHENTPTL